MASMPTKHFADFPERGRDLWRVTYADPPTNWLQQAQIYRERQTGEAWGAIAVRHRCSVAAVQARYRVVAEHLEKLAETEGSVSAATVLCRCPGVRKQVIERSISGAFALLASSHAAVRTRPTASLGSGA